MTTGTIKKLVRDRGFGFILGQDGTEVFFHRSAIQGQGFDALTEGQAVEFEIVDGPKGPQAGNVVKV